MTPLRFGVVGCGAVSTGFHLPALRRCTAAKLVAVIDIDLGWARRVADRFGAPEAYGDFRQLIGQVDAVLVATPHATHADITCALLDAGIHVLCEKPIATTRADAERMFAASARSGARLMAGYTYRFSPSLAMLKQLVVAGWLGCLTEISGGFGRPYELGGHRTDFRRQRRLSGGGVLIDQGIHLIDLAIWLAGEVPCAVAYDGYAALGWGVEHDADVVLHFPAMGRATLSSSVTHSLSNSLFVRGRSGWARAPLRGPMTLDLFCEQARVCKRAGMQRLEFPDVSMYERQIRHFCDAIRTGEGFVVQSREVLTGMAVIDTCYAMAR